MIGSFLAPGLLACAECPNLVQSRTKVVPGYGNLDARIMMISQSPGWYEDRDGVPLSPNGKSGKFLRKIVRDLGYSLDRDFFRTNINLCHPENDRPCTKSEKAHCRPWLEQQIEAVNPDIIICLGAEATKELLPLESGKITDIRGNWYKRVVQGRERLIMPTVHPAYRNSAMAYEWITADIDKALHRPYDPETVVPFRMHEASWEEIMEVVRGPQQFAFDLETDSISRDTSVIRQIRAGDLGIVGLGVCAAEGDGRYFPFRNDDEAKRYLTTIRPYLEYPNHPIIAQNTKFEIQVLRAHGIRLRHVEDTMLMATVLGDRPIALENNFHRTFGVEPTHIESLIGPEGKKQRNLRDVQDEDPDIVVAYSSEDPDETLRLYHEMMPLLIERGLVEPYRIEIEFLPIVAEMEWNGMGFDVSALNEPRRLVTEHIEEVEHGEHGIHQLGNLRGCFHCPCRPEDHLKTRCRGCRESERSGYLHKFTDGVNVNSPKQVAELLYRRDHDYQIPPRHDGSLPTDKVTLAPYVVENPLVQKVLEARAARKLLGTYIDGLPKHVLTGPHGPRIHSDLNQSRAASGRMSSSRPNVQNITAREREDVHLPVAGKAVRKAFVARDGMLILAPDLSNIEMRVEADLSGDPTMIAELSKPDGDIHSRITETIYETDMSRWSPQEWSGMRDIGKMLGFGTLYGLTAHGLLLRVPWLGLTIEQAQRFIDLFFERFARVKEHQESVIAFGRKHGYVETMFGNRLYLPDLRSDDREVRANAERTAINYPVQGGAADIFKRIGIVASRRVRVLGIAVAFINQVHDELVAEGAVEAADKMARDVIPELEHVVELVVPTPIDFEVGENWGELVKWDVYQERIAS